MRMPAHRILIIEDDEVAAEILKQYVAQYEPEAEVDVCWNGVEALVRFQQFQPDLVLLDYMMPKFDGLEFVRAIRSLQPEGVCPILVISAYIDRERAEQFRQLGISHVLAKPVSAADFRSAVARLLPKKPA
jgi:CheY-like chemotaxis protein